MHPLIQAEKLAGVLDDVKVYDLRWDLSDPTKGRESYRRGHIPGAVFVDLVTDLAGPPGIGGRHPLPAIEVFADTLGRLGMTPTSHVVAYDDMEGRTAARMWWMLRSIGHEQVQVLDGGLSAWVEGGGLLADGDVTPDPVEYPTPDDFSGVVSNDQIGDAILVDARAAERYRGDIEPVDPKAGHIPGAVNIPTSENLDSSGRFHSADTLARLYADIPDGAPMSCGSGVTACHDALAMVVAGRRMPPIYIGSFSEWSRLDLPVNTGVNP